MLEVKLTKATKAIHTKVVQFAHKSLERKIDKSSIILNNRLKSAQQTEEAALASIKRATELKIEGTEAHNQRIKHIRQAKASIQS